MQDLNLFSSAIILEDIPLTSSLQFTLAACTAP
jgi:hypothetical protein